MGAVELTGQRFGRLTPIEWTGKKTKSGHNYIWLCKCDCGNYVEVSTGDLRSGSTVSCGCYTRDRMSKLNRTHGGRKERLYLVWMDMRRRCRDPKDVEYENYGGRGISVCDEWQSYEPFRAWAMSHGYDETAKQGQCTLDRIDTNKGYYPENCRFVDMKVQCNNKRNNCLVTYNGKTQTAAQWERELWLKRGSVAKKIKQGCSVEKALKIEMQGSMVAHESETTETTC